MIVKLFTVSSVYLLGLLLLFESILMACNQRPSGPSLKPEMDSTTSSYTNLDKKYNLDKIKLTDGFEILFPKNN